MAWGLSRNSFFGEIGISSILIYLHQWYFCLCYTSPIAFFLSSLRVQAQLILTWLTPWVGSVWCASSSIDSDLDPNFIFSFFGFSWRSTILLAPLADPLGWIGMANQYEIQDFYRFLKYFEISRFVSNIILFICFSLASLCILLIYSIINSIYNQ